MKIFGYTKTKRIDKVPPFLQNRIDVILSIAENKSNIYIVGGYARSLYLDILEDNYNFDRDIAWFYDEDKDIEYFYI